MSEKGKKNRVTISKVLFRIIFSRTAVCILLMLLQIFVLFLSFVWLSKYIVYIYGGFVLLSAFLIIRIINSRDNPDFKLAWILPVAIVPVFGSLIYLFFKIQPISILVRRRSRRLDKLTAEKSADPPDGLARYLASFGYPSYDNTQVRYYSLGEHMFADMAEQLEKAEHFIFLEYYIIADGEMWDRVRDILIRKAAGGVAVRLMYDGMGSLGRLPRGTCEELEKKGIQCRVFAPIYPALSTIQNNRDHRKILVIDGKVGFTGGINIADEYINEIARYGHWKDTGVMLQGGAVDSLTVMFLRNWALYGNETERFSDYLRQHSCKSDCCTVPFGESPFDDEDIGKRVYIDLISKATRYVHIMTPYLVIDSEMSECLQFAARSGVDVCLMVPFQSDSWLSSTVARTYYKELLAADVKIYEYLPGMVHAKLFVCDDIRAVVGTINLDYRSLFLNFECGCYLSGGSVPAEIEADYLACVKQCRIVTSADIKRYSLPRRFIGRVCRLLAPML